MDSICTTIHRIRREPVHDFVLRSFALALVSNVCQRYVVTVSRVRGRDLVLPLFVKMRPTTAVVDTHHSHVI
jgi:hypothetical protein